ncbi:L-threonine kinase [Streptomyces griseochromogenes]|uniref:Kinase n=1 Tax=Streptomyces griseochromogenes TaxID=68214 RepID=A0A1B1AZT2_9ACTN|nr:kinase [Streptomyces griseochromogenes]ANP52069.1 kinase [Streptomyces griseochromogenes]MBP2056296.1 L-threonine kinase [Streptomyces griseochromogenes]
MTSRQLIQRPGRYHGSHARAVAVSSAFGTFGELLQGALPDDGPDFLVTLPIARWVTATFEYESARDGVEVFPATKTKARRVAKAVLARYSTGGGSLRLNGSLPEGKGLASSSADLVATARAVASAVGVELPPHAIEDLLRQIEPTDGVMYPGVVAFEHRNVALLDRLGVLPPMTIVGIDEGGTVDTVAFNRIPKNFSVAERDEYARLLDEVRMAVRAGDAAAIGRVATRSAHLNQRLCRKRTLNAMTALSAEVGGVGVVTGHSGSTIGLMLLHDVPDFRSRLAEAINRCRQLAHCEQVFCYQTLGFELKGSGTSDDLQ